MLTHTAMVRTVKSGFKMDLLTLGARTWDALLTAHLGREPNEQGKSMEHKSSRHADVDK